MIILRDEILLTGNEIVFWRNEKTEAWVGMIFRGNEILYCGKDKRDII